LNFFGPLNLLINNHKSLHQVNRVHSPGG
jgi:hypothetical protein